VTAASARWVLMGDPAFFSVKGGANPHTRTRWGTRRSVDRALAISQWRRLHDLLRELGVQVLVVPPDPEQPGLVYPANAGLMLDVDEVRPLAATALEEVFGLAFEELPAEHGAGLWPQPVHEKISAKPMQSSTRSGEAVGVEQVVAGS